MLPSSSNPLAIKVQHIHKSYRLYEQPEDRLKHSLFWRFGRTYGRDFWALRDVSFQIKRGESVGIIGRNGSGKSTLLQIIAGTLGATSGEIEVHGRVAALLELGSGFNPEYTGRENVYLNGAILGMSREEMSERFDAIAGFADIGAYIEQPVKFYSSGMVLRLAFAVQAMTTKDILIVDEALAVGDEAFQRKCMRKLDDFRGDGGTVLLVTHSAEAIVRQCTRCLFMHEGQLVLDGPSKPVTDIYQRFLYGTAEEQHATLDVLRSHTGQNVESLLESLRPPDKSGPEAPRPEAAVRRRAPDQFDPQLATTSEVVYGNGSVEIFECAMTDVEGQEVNVLTTGETYIWRYRVRVFEAVRAANFGMSLRTVDGVVVAGINTEWQDIEFETLSPGTIIDVHFRLKLNLAASVYFTEAGVVGETERAVGPGGFLHRRVDISAIRVISPANQRIVGIAYLDPTISVTLNATPLARK